MKINKNTMYAVVAGMFVFGLSVWLIKKLPDNAVTTPVKSVVDAATGN